LLKHERANSLIFAGSHLPSISSSQSPGFSDVSSATYSGSSTSHPSGIVDVESVIISGAFSSLQLNY
jgi:hypothetical protein